jgi:hypothetical protein
MLRNILIIIALGALGACSTVTNQLPDDISDKMQECTKKKTTFAEIFCKKKK